MRILLAPSSFKGSINAYDVAHKIGQGLKKVLKDSEIIESPVFDGGMGTAEIITKILKESFVYCKTTGPLGEKLIARYGVVPQLNLAIIELARSAGLHLVSKNKLNPLKTTTHGVGVLIKEAIKRGYKKIILCVGDSATIDCGIGAMSVLGFEFLDSDGNPIEKNCQGLLRLNEIREGFQHKNLKDVKIKILCDVKNPLTGKDGAIQYAIQKGATKKTLPLIKKALENFKKNNF